MRNIEWLLFINCDSDFRYRLSPSILNQRLITINFESRGRQTAKLLQKFIGLDTTLYFLLMGDFHCLWVFGEVNSTQTFFTQKVVIESKFENIVILKRHCTTSASSPDFFQKNWDLYYTIKCVPVHLCIDRLLNLTCNFNLVFEFFSLQQPFSNADF